jgi:NADP-reducing hydrogenase subunit HndD
MMQPNVVNLKIDGKSVAVPQGSTLLDAARALDIEVPTLCHLNLEGTPMVNKAASCRICVVEVKGRRNLAPACATPVT